MRRTRHGMDRMELFHEIAEFLEPLCTKRIGAEEIAESAKCLAKVCQKRSVCYRNVVSGPLVVGHLEDANILLGTGAYSLFSGGKRVFGARIDIPSLVLAHSRGILRGDKNALVDRLAGIGNETPAELSLPALAWHALLRQASYRHLTGGLECLPENLFTYERANWREETLSFVLRKEAGRSPLGVGLECEYPLLARPQEE